MLFSLRVAPGRLKAVATCSWFIRALVAALVYLGNTFVLRKAYFSLTVLSSFLRRGNALMVKMEFTGMTRRTKEELEVHEELMVIQHWR